MMKRKKKLDLKAWLVYDIRDHLLMQLITK